MHKTGRKKVIGIIANANKCLSQRIQFDVSSLRPDLVGTANTDGTVAFWELSKITSDAAAAGPVDPHREGQHVSRCCCLIAVFGFQFVFAHLKLHNLSNSWHSVCNDIAAGGECVNGFSLHPFEDLFATSSGQRHYSAMDCDSDGDG